MNIMKIERLVLLTNLTSLKVSSYCPPNSSTTFKVFWIFLCFLEYELTILESLLPDNRGQYHVSKKVLLKSNEPSFHSSFLPNKFLRTPSSPVLLIFRLGEERESKHKHGQEWESVKDELLIKIAPTIFPAKILGKTDRTAVIFFLWLRLRWTHRSKSPNNWWALKVIEAQQHKIKDSEIWVSFPFWGSI